LAFSNQADDREHFLLGLLGQSLGHSLSPIIHQAFLDELGLSGAYNKIEVADDTQVAGKLLELASEGYKGLNVTIPYKLTVLPYLAALDQSAQLAGAVNTIKFDPQPTGYNTDISGLAEAVSQMDLAISKALILGSGGAARAAVIALSSLGFEQLEILSRSRDNVQAMLDQLMATAQRESLLHNCRTAVQATFDDFDLLPDKNIGAQVSLVINATPIGQKDKGLPPRLVQLLTAVVKKSHQPVFLDLVYAKTATPMCLLAQELGFERVEDGKEMLINQARLAFKIWTGHLPDGQLARQRLK
jgi:shikimate dehydrogenase